MPSNSTDWIVSGSSSTTANNVIWTHWVNSSTTSATTVNDPWPIWVANGTSGTVTASSTTASTIDIWGGWVRDHVRYTQGAYRQQRVREASPEEVRQAQQRAQEAQQRRLVAEGERAAARERAQLLLNESLTEEQRAELADKGHFSFRSISKDGRVRHYRIKRGYMQNIHEIEPESGRILNTICAHPQMRVPDEDAMLIQKLMLQDPDSHDQFLRVANIRQH